MCLSFAGLAALPAAPAGAALLPPAAWPPPAHSCGAQARSDPRDPRAWHWVRALWQGVSVRLRRLGPRARGSAGVRTVGIGRQPRLQAGGPVAHGCWRGRSHAAGRARPVQTFYFDHHFHRCREGVQVTRGMMQQELQAWVQVWPSSRGAAKPWAAAGLVPAGAVARRNTGAQTPTPSVPGRPPPPPGWVRRRQQPQGGCSGPRHAVAQAVDAWCSPQGDDCRLVVAAMLIRSAPARDRLLRIPAAPSCAPAGQQFETGQGGF